MAMTAKVFSKSEDYLPDRVIIEKLKEAEAEAADPTVKRLSYEEVFGKMRKKYGYDV